VEEEGDMHEAKDLPPERRRHVRPPLCERVERGMHVQQVLGSSDREGNNGGRGRGGGRD
jgi:hypothetical protein